MFCCPSLPTLIFCCAGQQGLLERLRISQFPNTAEKMTFMFVLPEKCKCDFFKMNCHHQNIHSNGLDLQGKVCVHVCMCVCVCVCVRERERESALSDMHESSELLLSMKLSASPPQFPSCLFVIPGNVSS